MRQIGEEFEGTTVGLHSSAPMVCWLVGDDSTKTGRSDPKAICSVCERDITERLDGQASSCTPPGQPFRDFALTSDTGHQLARRCGIAVH